MTGIRFTFISDRPAFAMRDLLACASSNCPSWAAFVSDPDAVLAIPSGMKCRAIWYSGRGQTQLERAWRERRLIGGLVYIDDADEARIHDWVARHLARARERRGLAPVEAPAPVLAIARPEPELQNMVVSQRWT